MLIHLVLYAVRIVMNLGIAVSLGTVPSVAKFDPSFVILALESSVEAIFLSTFVLITQNRLPATATKRASICRSAC